jgi:hypothetical protein
MHLLQIALQTDDGIFLPEGGASTVVWVLFAAIIAALYWTISRTRRRAEQQFWDRKRREEDERTKPEPEEY